MTNQLKNLFNSYVSEFAMLIIVCCMIGSTLPLRLYAEWTAIAVASALIGGIVLFAWLIWATYILISKKRVKGMSMKSMLIVETCSRILMLYWAYLVSESFLVVLPFALLFAWEEYRLIMDIRGTNIESRI